MRHERKKMAVTLWVDPEIWARYQAKITKGLLSREGGSDLLKLCYGLLAENDKDFLIYLGKRNTEIKERMLSDVKGLTSSASTSSGGEEAKENGKEALSYNVIKRSLIDHDSENPREGDYNRRIPEFHPEIPRGAGPLWLQKHDASMFKSNEKVPERLTPPIKLYLLSLPHGLELLPEHHNDYGVVDILYPQTGTGITNLADLLASLTGRSSGELLLDRSDSQNWKIRIDPPIRKLIESLGGPESALPVSLSDGPDLDDPDGST